MAVLAADEPVLRAKYLDWCSARIAERFLRLTPDEIYELAQAPAALEPVSYRTLVCRATDALAAHLKLPLFETWAEAYRASPGRYDHELLGFWKDAMKDE